MDKWGMLLILVCVLAVAGCGGKRQTGDSDWAARPPDILAADGSGENACGCSICQAACVSVEWLRQEECPVPEPWHYEWCEQAQCGRVYGKCVLVGPEPVTPKGVVADVGKTDMAVADSVALDEWQGTAFGEPCDANFECAGGYCVHFVGDINLCSEACQYGCPEGWECVCNQSLGCEEFLCVPADAALCAPCHLSKDCPWLDACLDSDELGDVCVDHCMDDADCPEGHECVDGSTVEGTKGKWCVPAGGAQCKCSQEAALARIEGACLLENEFGACPGTRKCLSDGTISECVGQMPAAEACNGADDDCDGGVDEDVPSKPCQLVNAYGICPGMAACVDGEWECEGEPAKAETCDGLDNDCDGKVDEDFQDGNGNGIPDCGEPVDPDGDGIPVYEDNCPEYWNPDQADFDEDAMGDVCDPDDDNDLVKDEEDCSPFDSKVYPGAAELCDAKDNDCDMEVDEECECVPTCAGKECGNDGCGGECPDLCNHECAGGPIEICVWFGACMGTCVPQCFGKECGDDGCGCPCGECSDGFTCQNHTCICAPQCGGKDCGGDGCDGICGTCPEGMACSEEGTCV